MGAIAGALAQIFTIPVAVIATRQQVGRSAKKQTYLPKSSNDSQLVDDDSFLAVGRKIVREDGIGGLWLGIRPGLVLTVNPAITYGVFERVKGLVLLGSADTKLTPWQSFAVGASSKTLATIVWECFSRVLTMLNLCVGHIPVYHGESEGTNRINGRR